MLETRKLGLERGEADLQALRMQFLERELGLECLVLIPQLVNKGRICRCWWSWYLRKDGQLNAVGAMSELVLELVDPRLEEFLLLLLLVPRQLSRDCKDYVRQCVSYHRL